MRTGPKLLVVLALLAALVWVVADLMRSPTSDRSTPPPAPSLSEGPAAQAAPTPPPAPAAPETARGAIPAPSSTPVQGVVLNPNGGPLRGARVMLHRLLSPWPESRSEEIDSVYTDGMGGFRFRYGRGPDLMVIAEHPNYARERVLAYEEDPNLTLRMRPGFEVSGIVLDPDGVPVSDCTVVLEPGSWDMRRAESVTTDRRGAFRLPRVRAGIARVSARHPQYQPAVLPSVTVGTSDGLTLQFQEGALVLTGTVVTTDNPPRPVTNGVVRGLPNTWNGGLFLPQEASTDDQGGFRLTGLGPGNLRVEVRHADYSTTARVVSMGPATQPLDIEMGTRSRVRGQLSGAVTPEELQGLTLVITNTVGEQGRTAVGADGTFVFPGTYSAGPTALEIEGGRLAFAKTSSCDIGVRVQDSAITSLDLPVFHPSVVAGFVRNESGEPIQGALVYLSRLYQRLPSPEKLIGVTGAEGEFEIPGLPVGTVSARIAHEKYANRIMSLEVPPPGETLQAPDIVLAEAGDIHGSVTLDDGRPVAGALVQATLGTETVAVDVTSPDGRYRLRDLSPGRYRLRALYSTLPVAVADEAVEVESGVIEGPIPLLFPAGRTIVGVVEDADGRPLEDAAVTVSGAGGSVVITDVSGRFTMEVPRRELVLQAFSSDFSVNTARAVGLEEDQVTLRLETAPTGTLVARVLGLPGRRPVPGGIVRVTPIFAVGAASFPERRINSRWVEMRDGVLRMPSFPAGTSRLVLQSEDYGPLVQEVRVEPRGETTLGEILLEPGNVVRGVVTGVDGRPVPGAMVFLGREIDEQQFEQFGTRPETSTDANGQFELRGVTPDSTTLVVAAADYATRTVELRIPEDLLRREPMPISLERGSTIRVRVLDSRGKPWESSIVLLMLEGSVVAPAYADESGMASFPHRSPGEYEVTLFGSQAVNRAVLVERTGQEYEVTLQDR